MITETERARLEDKPCPCVLLKRFDLRTNGVRLSLVGLINVLSKFFFLSFISLKNAHALKFVINLIICIIYLSLC